MYIDAVVVKGEGKSFSVQINTVKDGATTNLTVNDFVPFPLSGYDDNGDAFAYSVIFRVLGAPTADAEVLVEHLITENSDMEVDGQIDNPTNGQFTFTINKDDTDTLGLGKFPIQIILVDAESLIPQFTLTEGGEKGEFSKIQIVQV